jgi:hypothetical protein
MRARAGAASVGPHRQPYDQAAARRSGAGEVGGDEREAAHAHRVGENRAVTCDQSCASGAVSA